MIAVAAPVLATTATELAPVAMVADLTVTVSVRVCAAKTKLVIVTTVGEVRVKTPWAIAAALLPVKVKSEARIGAALNVPAVRVIVKVLFSAVVE